MTCKPSKMARQLFITTLRGYESRLYSLRVFSYYEMSGPGRVRFSPYCISLFFNLKTERTVSPTGITIQRIHEIGFG